MRPTPDKTKMERAAVLYTQGSSLREAARTVGVSHTGLWRWLNRHDVDRRPRGRASPLTRDLTRSILRAHQREHKSLREIAKSLGIDRETAKKAILGSGHMIFGAKQMRGLMRERRDDELRPKIEVLYKQGLALREIAVHLRTDIRRVRRIVVAL